MPRAVDITAAEVVEVLRGQRPERVLPARSVLACEGVDVAQLDGAGEVAAIACDWAGHGGHPRYQGIAEAILLLGRQLNGVPAFCPVSECAQGWLPVGSPRARSLAAFAELFHFYRGIRLQPAPRLHPAEGDGTVGSRPLDLTVEGGVGPAGTDCPRSGRSISSPQHTQDEEEP